MQHLPSWTICTQVHNNKLLSRYATLIDHKQSASHNLSGDGWSHMQILLGLAVRMDRGVITKEVFSMQGSLESIKTSTFSGVSREVMARVPGVATISGQGTFLERPLCPKLIPRKKQQSIRAASAKVAFGTVRLSYVNLASVPMMKRQL